MEKKKKKRSVALERRVQVYLTPKNHSYFKGFVSKEEFSSESEAINHIVKSYFALLAESTRSKYVQKV